MPFYPGTLGGVADYIVAGASALPTELAPFFSEKIVTLPHSIFPHSNRLRADSAPSREACGLVDGAFVFACFTGTRKITPAVFGLWMELLRAVDGSLLWLGQDDAIAVENLRAAAGRAGIDPTRLVFAAPVERDVHLARLRYANLMLDTTPDNADLAFGDALSVGVPGIACSGRSLAARRSAALLEELGLAELVAPELAGLKALALDLAADPKRLKALRAGLDAARKTAPAFDATAIARMLEAAFAGMVAEWRGRKLSG